MTYRSVEQCAIAFGMALMVSWGCTLDLSQKHRCASDGQCLTGRICVEGACQDRSVLDAGDGAAALPNHVFVTSGTFSAKLESLEAADAQCNAAAGTAGLPGIYRAWLSTSQVDARDRLSGARGWIRPDGEPVADTVDDLRQGRIFNPISLDEHQARADGPVITGTNVDGRFDPDRNCNDWTNDTTATATAGTPEGTTGVWTFFTTLPCGTKGRLYCFGVDAAVPVLPKSGRGKLAFLSDDPFEIGGGLVAADAQCEKEAAAAGFPGAFRALLATSTASAGDRFGANAGAIWMRADNVPINRGLGDAFTLQSLLSPLNVTSKKRYMDANVFTGATDPSVRGDASETCGDWSGTAATAVMGRANYIPWWFDIRSRQPCVAGAAAIYCLQVD